MIDAEIKKAGIVKGKISLNFKDDQTLYHFIKEMEGWSKYKKDILTP